MKAGRSGFGVFFDPGKSTSGQRFFHDLVRALSGEAAPLEQRPAAVLFNVSAPIVEILKAKRRGQRILLRIDGMYFDRLSPAFLASFSSPMRTLLALGTRWSAAHDFFAFLANLVNQNYGAFARILLADRLIYQSVFSRDIHTQYFPRKLFDTVVNGSVFRAHERPMRAAPEGEIRLITTYDDWKPAKRVHDLVAFVHWARVVRGIPLRLTVLGYTGNIPACAPSETRSLLESSSYVDTLPRFKDYDGTIRDALFASDLYITFTHKDPCPNTVIEAMAHGLPVVGVDSGGMPDIVGDAGILVSEETAVEAFFTAYRYECDFPPVSFDKVLDAVAAVVSRRSEFEARTAARFATDLSIDIVAARYAAVLRRMAGMKPLSPGIDGQ